MSRAASTRSPSPRGGSRSRPVRPRRSPSSGRRTTTPRTWRVNPDYSAGSTSRLTTSMAERPGRYAARRPGSSRSGISPGRSSDEAVTGRRLVVVAVGVLGAIIVLGGVLGLGRLLAQATPSVATGPPRFVDVTASSGLEHTYTGDFPYSVG